MDPTPPVFLPEGDNPPIPCGEALWLRAERHIATQILPGILTCPARLYPQTPHTGLSRRPVPRSAVKPAGARRERSAARVGHLRVLKEVDEGRGLRKPQFPLGRLSLGCHGLLLQSHHVISNTLQPQGLQQVLRNAWRAFDIHLDSRMN
ncbi:hypothetical protein EYF80_033548 [Liparis tanakae]|uniref:Uncharacterized protein n=1 Tax=Liparis tanakae TaxID=230148 RepID=A0A4Z2GT28_9TELE|nr:hypothetical protein EYF80_033548 [Liparis tanakae]